MKKEIRGISVITEEEYKKDEPRRQRIVEHILNTRIIGISEKDRKVIAEIDLELGANGLLNKMVAEPSSKEDFEELENIVFDCEEESTVEDLSSEFKKK